MIELTTQKIAEVTGSTLINDVDPQAVVTGPAEFLSLIHISEPTRPAA